MTSENTCSAPLKGEYELEMPKSHIADQTIVPLGGDPVNRQPQRNQNKMVLFSSARWLLN